MGIMFGRAKESVFSQNYDLNDEETEEYKSRIRLLQEIGEEATSVSEGSKLLERILKVIQQTVHASAASLLLTDEAKGDLYFQVVLGDAEAKLRQMRLVPDRGIAGWVARNARPVLANDVTTDSRFDRNIDDITGFSTESIIAVPLKRGVKVIAVLEVLNKSDGSEFTVRDMRVLEGFTSIKAVILLVSMAATAINNINSLALDQALLDGYRSTAEAWASAVDTRDSFAYAHSQRVKEYTMLAANYLNLSLQELQAIEFGALFHDIGKIDIDVSMLSKPGPLTDEEWNIMREHSQKGASIVGEIPFLDKAKEIVLYHHEKYDGTGYPAGLEGESIPIGARLVAVADAFDTMTTDHSYRASLGVDKAITELIEGIGTQFCPVAVEAFVSAFKKHNGKIFRVTNDGTSINIIRSERKSDQIKEIKRLRRVVISNDDAKIYEGDVRLTVPFTVGRNETMRFKRYLEKIENLKIILTGCSEDEGHIILLSVKEPTPLLRTISKIPLVEHVDKHGKDIVVTLKKIYN